RVGVLKVAWTVAAGRMRMDAFGVVPEGGGRSALVEALQSTERVRPDAAGALPMPLLFMDDFFLQHDTGRHPESSERLRSVHHDLARTGLAGRFARGLVEPVSAEAL